MASTAIEFSPRYSRFPQELTELLIRISGALGAIRNAPVPPAVADQLRASAKAGTVHYSTMIEGNELPFVEAERAARKDLQPDTRAKIELVNYVAALDLIDERLAAGALELTAEFLKELHGKATAGLGREEDSHFKPHHEGEWRDGEAVVVDRLTQQVMHTAPPPGEVRGRMTGMFEWLERKLTTDVQPPFVLAGVMHYGITDVHPFADGNGRAARLFQTALLMKTDVLPGRMYSFERYYAEDQNAYYAALRSVRLRTLNMEHWLEYFLRGLAEEYERVAETVADLSSLVAGGVAGPLQLTSSQQAGLSALRIQGRHEFSRREYEQAARVGRSAANSDLKQLVQHRVLETRGSGSATRYVFSAAVPGRPAGTRRGRPTTWNDTLIEHELRGFLADRDDWPSPKEFQNAGHGDLYAAASRSGGIARWRRMLGL
jgi:Fic family protein